MHRSLHLRHAGGLTLAAAGVALALGTGPAAHAAPTFCGPGVDHCVSADAPSVSSPIEDPTIGTPPIEDPTIGTPPIEVPPVVAPPVDPQQQLQQQLEAIRAAVGGWSMRDPGPAPGPDPEQLRKIQQAIAANQAAALGKARADNAAQTAAIKAAQAKIEEAASKGRSNLPIVIAKTQANIANQLKPAAIAQTQAKVVNQLKTGWSAFKKAFGG